MDFDRHEASDARLAPVLAHAKDPTRRTGCHVKRDGSRARVRLWGALPFEWCGNLSLQCLAARVSIVEADARHVGKARWAASLVISPAGEGASVDGLDFLAMARRRPGLVPLPDHLEPASFRLEPPRPDGSASLFVSAPDRLGLLANLLSQVLACGLRPRELRVRTPEGRAEDWFALEGDAGQPPSPRALALLEAALGSAAPVPRPPYI